MIDAAGTHGEAATATTGRNRAPYSRARRLSGPERREHFLDVAAALILDRGVEAVTMEAIAAAAGVSKGLGYAYFANRNALLIGVLERELIEFGRRADAGVRAASNFEGRLRAAIGAWFDVMTERGVLIGTLLTINSLQGPLEERRQAWNRDTESLYAGVIEREFGIDPEKGRAAAAILLAGLSGVLERWTRGGDSREVLEATYVDIIIGGLRALADTSGHDGAARR